MIIDGKKIAGEIIEELKGKPGGWRDKFISALLVGDDSASVNFLKQKEKVAKELGISFRLHRAPVNVKTDDLRAEIGMLSRPKNCGGFLVQLPLPESINKHYVLNAIPKEKDVDCLSEQSLGAFYTERGKVAPPAVGTLEEVFRHQFISESPSFAKASEDKLLRNLKVVLIGAGFLIGKPLGFWLQNRVGELTVLDNTVKDVHKLLGEADVVVSGTGVAGLFSADDLKDGAVVIDFGYSRKDGKICGDFLVSDEVEKNISYTPTPGGTGPILVAKLYENFYKLNS